MPEADVERSQAIEPSHDCSRLPQEGSWDWRIQSWKGCFVGGKKGVRITRLRKENDSNRSAVILRLHFFGNRSVRQRSAKRANPEIPGYRRSDPSPRLLHIVV